MPRDKKQDRLRPNPFYRGGATKCNDFLCGDRGLRKIWYNPNNSEYIIEKISKDWTKYWSVLEAEYLRMLKENEKDGDYDWGNRSLFSGPWEIRIFDSFTEEDPLDEGLVIFELVFIVDGREQYPVWHVFLVDYIVEHSQPVF